ncbi:MAG: glutamine--tRNA ligase, partial [Selenomonadaceae bacterium]|nr:glutamine--tRNA ligase [Selenomonadaceae bacterium]
GETHEQVLKELAAFRLTAQLAADDHHQSRTLHHGENSAPVRGGSRTVPFTREIFIEREDFMEDAPKKFFRLKPGGEVRLKHAYIIKCNAVVKNFDGEVVELHCTIDPTSKSGGETAGRKIKGTIHWVSAKYALPVEVRLYDYLLTTDADGNLPDDFIAALNPNSLIVKHALIEPSVRENLKSHYQFLRLGYFVVDPDTTSDKLVFNRVVGLKDTWAKVRDK